MHSTQRTGPVTWRMRVSRASESRGGEAGVDVGGDGDGGVVEADAFELDHEGFLGGLHEGAVEGGADGEHDDLFGSGSFSRGRRRGGRRR